LQACWNALKSSPDAYPRNSDQKSLDDAGFRARRLAEGMAMRLAAGWSNRSLS
jgi:hypothetical protein